MEKRTKYDTNPLDPDFVKGTEEMGDATRDLRRTPNEHARRDENAEAPTRRYDNPAAMPSSYPSVFVPPVYAPPMHQQSSTPPPPPVAPPIGAPQAKVAPPTSRTIPGLNLPENVVMILPYLPFPVIGGVMGMVELFLVPRSEGRVRFHAAQGLALHLLVLAVGFLFKTADRIVDGTVGGVIGNAMNGFSALFSVAAFVFFIISMIRVWKGEDHRVEPLMDATRWLNGKIDPRK